MRKSGKRGYLKESIVKRIKKNKIVMIFFFLMIIILFIGCLLLCVFFIGFCRILRFVWIIGNFWFIRFLRFFWEKWKMGMKRNKRFVGFLRKMGCLRFFWIFWKVFII